MPPTEQVSFPLCTFVSFVLKPLTLKPQKDTKVHEGEPTDIEWWSLPHWVENLNTVCEWNVWPG
jgi:hypothetical protein